MDWNEIPLKRLAWYGLGLTLALFALLGSCGCSPSAWTDLETYPQVEEEDPGEEDLNQVPGTKRARWRWTAPTSGSPVDRYLVQTKKGSADWQAVTEVPDTTVSLIHQPGVWRVRVAGVDSLDRQGPFSDPSDPYTVRKPVDDLPDIHDPTHPEERR